MKAWNNGEAIGRKAPLTPRHIHAIKTVLANESKLRDLALFSTAIDLLALKVEDVDDDQNTVREPLNEKDELLLCKLPQV